MKLTPKEYTDPAEKKKDFWKGFWLWWVLNILLCFAMTALSGLMTGFATGDNTAINSIAGTLSLVISFIPLLINVGLIIYFAVTRAQMMLGMLAAFGAALGVVVLLGIIFTVACFVMSGSGNGTGIW